MLGFVGNLARKHGLAPKNDDNLKANKPSQGGINYNNDMLAHMRIGSKWSYSTLEYPLDVQQRADLSHYMMFYVNVPNTTNFPINNETHGAGSKNPYSVGANIQTEDYKQVESQSKLQSYQGFSQKNGDGSSSYDASGQTWKPGESNKVVERAHHDGTAAEILGTKRTTRTNDSIVLYMPPQINLNTTAGYKDSELGAMLGESAGAIKAFMDTSSSEGIMKAGLEAVPNIASIVQEQIEKAGAALASQVGMGDIRGAYKKLANSTENNYTETIFTGVGFRSFSWMWRFTPKSPEEAEMVDKIIRTFRFYMLPELPKDKRFGRFFVTPAEFDIFYMFRGEENSFLNKITSCVLKNCTVNYSPTQYQTFRPMQGRKGAPPIEIEMKLDFQETKLITKEDVLEGY